MDGATVVSIVAAAVSLAAMGVSVWQGHSAHKAAGAAKRQADSSQQAADAAERSAAAAEVANEAQQRAEDEADGPQFELLMDPTFDQSEDVDVFITMVSGPRLEQVAITAVGETTGVTRLDKPRTLSSLIAGDMSEGDRYSVNVGLEHWGITETITLHLDCVELGGRRRTWRRSCRLADARRRG